MRLGFIIHGMTFFKSLGPLIEEAVHQGYVPFIFYFTGNYAKKYDVAQPKDFPKSMAAIKRAPFNNYSSLPKLMRGRAIDWVVGITLHQKTRDINKEFSKLGIKKCSIMNFTDAFWVNKITKEDIKNVDLVCYQSKYSLNFHKTYLHAGKLTRCINSGLPILDSRKRLPKQNAIMKRYGLPKDFLLIMLPNLRKGEIPMGFGSIDKFSKLIKSICKIAKSNGIKVVGKSRRKQWHPKDLESGFEKIIYDEHYYPNTSYMLMSCAKNTISFNSSSVFDAATLFRYTINFNTSLKFSNGYKSRGFQAYFNSGVYNYEGVVNTLQLDEVSRVKYFIGREADVKQVMKYKERFLTDNHNSKKIIESMS